MKARDLINLCETSRNVSKETLRSILTRDAMQYLQNHEDSEPEMLLDGADGSTYRVSKERDNLYSVEEK